MKVEMQAFQLMRLVTQLNYELQEQLIKCICSTPRDCVIGWNEPGDDERMYIRGETKMVEIRPVALPVSFIPGGVHAMSLSGAKIEVVGFTRSASGEAWMSDTGFGDASSLAFTVASLEPDHIKQTAETIAKSVSEYLNTQYETC